MTTLLNSTVGGIEVSLVRFPQRYVVSVTDAEGLLHQTEFRYNGASEIACAEALEWYDNVQSCVDEYLKHPTSQTIRSLVSFLN